MDAKSHQVGALKDLLKHMYGKMAKSHDDIVGEDSPAEEASESPVEEHQEMFPGKDAADKMDPEGSEDPQADIRHIFRPEKKTSGMLVIAKSSPAKKAPPFKKKK